MLHILLFILKIIGILLAVILGIILLAVCVVLFVPVCYRAEGESKGTLEDMTAHGQISWLFGLVKVVVEWKEKTASYYIKIAWKKLGDAPGGEKEREDADDEEIREERGKAYGDEEVSEPYAESRPEIGKEREEGKEDQKTDAKAVEEVPPVSERVERPAQESGPPDQEEEVRSAGIFEKINGKIRGVFEGIQKTLQKIKCTFRDFCDKIREIFGKKDRVAAFIKDETHLGALRKGKQEVFKLFRRLSPKILAADIHYGFEDPCLTGQVLAVLGALYPLIGEHTEITPDFQEKVLEGRLKIRGRIYVVHLVMLAVNMLLCREVRQTIKDIRNFKL